MPELKKNFDGLDDGLPRHRHFLFTRFLAVSLPVILALGYVIWDLTGRIEPGVLLRLGAGILFLYLALLYLTWRASRVVGMETAMLHNYAMNLEERVRERTRELEESTAREIEAAKEVARLKDEFIFIAAHELRTPVSVLKWATDRMKRNEEFSGLSSDLREHLHLVESSADKLSALISDLLDVARLESFKISFDTKPVKMDVILDVSVSGLLPLAKERKVAIEFDVQSFNKLPEVLGDELKLQEVFSNLISNAIKFNRSGGKVVIAGREAGSFVEIMVKDTGIGVKKSDFPRLFTKFFRARDEVEGTGLGLWISKEIMRRLEGDLTVESEEGSGSTFTVKIPIVPS